VPLEGTVYKFLFHDSAKVKGSAFSIYPLPTRGKLYFNLLETTPAFISVSDLLGRILINNIKLQDNQMDISNLRSGMYYISLTQGVHIDSKKVILTR
jgi:hypothetical protein